MWPLFAAVTAAVVLEINTAEYVLALVAGLLAMIKNNTLNEKMLTKMRITQSIVIVLYISVHHNNIFTKDYTKSSQNKNK